MSTRTRVPGKTNGGGQVKLHAPKKLSLACGQNKPEGYFGIDISENADADLVYDLMTFPWPIKTSSVQEISCVHFVEHIPHWRPWFDAGKDGWFHFFDEVYRICKKDAVCTFVHPYAMSARAFWDPTHVRYIHEQMWYYLDPAWRQGNGLDHYPTVADFEVTLIEGTGVDEDTQSRHHEAQQHRRLHYWNIIADLVVMLKARK